MPITIKLTFATFPPNTQDLGGRGNTLQLGGQDNLSTWNYFSTCKLLFQ